MNAVHRNAQPITTEEFFEVTGFEDEDLISVVWRNGQAMEFAFVAVENAALTIMQHPDTDVWISAGVLSHRPDEGRGSASDTARIPALFADIDFKDGGAKDEDSAWALVDEVSSLLGVAPVAVVKTGGGLHPRWTVEDGVNERDLKLFGQLVRTCATALGLHVDSVWDAARILRAPGSRNHKYDPPADVVVVEGNGAPLTLDALHEVFEAYSVTLPSDLVEEGPAGTGPIDATRGDNYVTKALGYVGAELQAAQTWADDFRDDRGRGWEKLTADAAKRIAEFVKAPWNTLTAEQGRAFLVQHAPQGGAWDTREIVKKWASQYGRATAAKQPADLQPTTKTEIPGMTFDPSDPLTWPAGYSGPESKAAPTPTTADGAELSNEDLARKRASELNAADQANFFAHNELKGRWVWSKGLGWMQFNGKVWRERPTEAVREVVSNYYIRLVESESTRIITAAGGWGNVSDADAKYLQTLRKCLKRSFFEDIVALSTAKVEVDAATAFDTRHDLLNVANGVVNLRTGELLPHDASYFLTKITDTEYHSDAQSNEYFLEALNAFSEPAVRDWMQIRLGQGVTGFPPPDDLLLILKGGGENGKSTVLGACNSALGEHAILVDDKVLLASGDDSHSTEKTDLRGARMALLEEAPGGRELDMTKIKKVVGSAKIKGRKMRMDSMEWKPTHSLFITTNHSLVVKDTDHGAWRRLALVDFPFRFRKPGEVLEQDTDRHGNPLLRQLIEQEEPAIMQAFLAWMVQGAVKWFEAGRIFPELPTRIATDTLAWRKETDFILAFVEENLVFDTNAHVLSAELYEDFKRFMAGNGHVWSAQAFKRNFTEHSIVTSSKTGVAYTKVRNHDRLSRPTYRMMDNHPVGAQNVYRGVRFKTAADELADQPAGFLQVVSTVDPLVSR